jgi:hypothetical protein
MFFEWREGHAKLIGANVAPVQHAAPPAAAPPNAQRSARLNLLVRVTNRLATLVMSIVLLQLFVGNRQLIFRSQPY